MRKFSDSEVFEQALRKSKNESQEVAPEPSPQAISTPAPTSGGQEAKWDALYWLHHSRPAFERMYRAVDRLTYDFGETSDGALYQMLETAESMRQCLDEMDSWLTAITDHLLPTSRSESAEPNNGAPVLGTSTKEAQRGGIGNEKQTEANS